MKNYDNLLREKIENAKNMLYSTQLSYDDKDLETQLSFGDKWDDPATITEALDLQPIYYARWLGYLRKLKEDMKYKKDVYDLWESNVKSKIEDMIYKNNIKRGMTANNAKPSAYTINAKFSSMILKSSKFKRAYDKYKIPFDEISEDVSVVEIIVKAFEQRKDTLMSLVGFIRFQHDNKLVLLNSSKKFPKRKNRGNENEEK